jgi:hypothetical protein
MYGSTGTVERQKAAMTTRSGRREAMRGGAVQLDLSRTARSRKRLSYRSATATSVLHQRVEDLPALV